MLSSFNQLLQSLPSLPFIFIPLLIFVILALSAVILVLVWRLQRQRVPAQTIDEQEVVRAPLEATRQRQEETQSELEEMQRQLADTRQWIEKARKQREEIQQELEETRKQLVETQEELAVTQKRLAEIQEQPEEVQIGDERLANKPWLKLTQQCVALFDELDRKSASMDLPRQELAGYVSSQLEEILERSGVAIISGDSAFDESRHRPYPAVSRVPAGTVIAETLSPGFVIGSRVLRRAYVRLAGEAS